MHWVVTNSHEEMSGEAARLFFDALSEKADICLGLPTGSTPLGLYRLVTDGHVLHGRSYARVVTFNLDEYSGIPSSHPGSFASYMKRNLFDHVDIPPDNVHIPDGLAARIRDERPDLGIEEALHLECQGYENEIRRQGGLDLTFLGLGHNGHIAFNEPGTPLRSRTHVIELDESTRRANAESFPGEDVPRRALTMGIGTILDSRRIILLASGADKAPAVKRLVYEPVSESFPASVLKTHPDVHVVVDRYAASLLPSPAHALREIR